ncbi:MAG: FtsX-like permease family protein, partial [Deltaproteobacteria bacterium]
SFTKSGYLRSASVKVYGTFHFKGLEGSDLAGAENLLDLQTFRELYGYLTASKRRELQALHAELGVEDIGREAAEQAFFGQSTVEAQPLVNAAQHGEESPESAEEASPTTLPGASLDEGLALNAAVLLQRPEAIGATRAAIDAAIAQQGLGLQTIDWQSASGVIGQLIFVLRLVLYVAIFIIFAVSLVIINNAMLMATTQRTAEIGTLRAMGASRVFVLSLLMVETLLLGTLAGCAGSAAGSVIVSILGRVGIPAVNDIMIFLFSGPRLFPQLAFVNLAFGIVIILIVSLLSALYPARLAAAIAPVVAMQAKD